MSSDSWEALGEVPVQAKEDRNSHYLVNIREGMKDLQLLGTGSAMVYWGNTGISLCSLRCEMHRLMLNRTWKPENNSCNSIVYDFMLANPRKCTICYVKESAFHKDFNL